MAAVTTKILFSIMISVSIAAHKPTAQYNHLTSEIQLQKVIPDPDIPKECLEKGYCEYVPNYPEKHVALVIEKLQHWKTYVQDSTFNTTMQSESPSITLCHVTKKTITPQAMRDSNGTWHFILNQEKKPVQRFQAVECNRSPNNTLENCGRFMIFTGASPLCQQKYTTIRLRTLSRYGTMDLTTFPIPCCCTCEAACKNIVNA